MGDNDIYDAWIGLRKMEGTCKEGTASSQLDCHRKDWTWQDGAEYTYPDWHTGLHLQDEM